METKIKKAIKNDWVKRPPVNFTTSVMNRVFELKPISYDPLVSKRGWVALMLMVMLTIAGAFFINLNAPKQNHGIINELLGQKMEAFTLPTIDSQFVNVLAYISAVLFAIFLLLAFDHYLKRKSN